MSRATGNPPAPDVGEKGAEVVDESGTARRRQPDPSPALLDELQLHNTVTETSPGQAEEDMERPTLATERSTEGHSAWYSMLGRLLASRDGRPDERTRTKTSASPPNQAATRSIAATGVNSTAMRPSHRPGHSNGKSESSVKGQTIGRYRVERVLGHGGMGAVYAAHDPELDRPVAIKLIQTRKKKSANKRLAREAHALARLSHPNVVQVYDAGAYGESVFVAMELIEGTSLKEWCAREPRPHWRQILRVYLEAARGITAAHDSGLIHRDIKPSNILVGDDGRVRVADFGLAAAYQASLRGPDSSGGQESSDSQNGQLMLGLLDSDDRSRDCPDSSHDTTSSSLRIPLGERLTQTGTLVGTPAFMAPEQHFGATVGPAADQYSFCVSLYTALYSELPFVRPTKPRTLAGLLDRKLNGKIDAPPGSEVPRWLHKVLVRGLAADPEKRYPSMHALVAALYQSPARRLRGRLRNAAMAAVIVAMLAMLAMLGWERHNAGAMCEGLGEELAGVWDGDVKAAMKLAFAATGVSYADDTHARVSTILDDYAASWLAMRTRTCQATHVHQRQPERIMDLRIACLDRRRDQLGALTQFYVDRADRDVVDRAVKNAKALVPMDHCGDIEALRAAVPPPEDPRVRARVEALQTRLDELTALFASGKYRAALDRGAVLLSEMRDVDYAPIRAHTMYLLAQLKNNSGDFAGAEALVRDIIPLAAGAKDDILAARAWSLLIMVLGAGQSRLEEANNLFGPLNAALERADDSLTRAVAFHNQANVLKLMGKYEQGLAKHQWALRIHEAVLDPDDPRVAVSLGYVATMHKDMGRYQKALDHQKRALAILRQGLGPDHPDVANSLNTMAALLRHLGRYRESRVRHQWALAIRQRTLGPSHYRVADSLNNLAIVFVRSGRYQEARHNSERAAAIYEEALGGDHRRLGNSLDTLALVLREMGQYDQARSVAERSFSIFNRALAPGHPVRAYPLIRMGRASVQLDQLDAAEGYLARALAIQEEGLGRHHPALAETLLGLGEVELARGKPAAAVSLTERALAVGNQEILPAVKLALAQALWAAGKPASRARNLAQEARDYYHQIGHQTKFAEASQWLDSHSDERASTGLSR
ncbi:MAG: serine/threonine-protein kinase [Proteobacteria bacterium]|nr:serine/threonine-protein kinase [Pseudomonadota bacterium]